MRTALDIPAMSLFLIGKPHCVALKSGSNSEIKHPPLLTISSIKRTFVFGYIASAESPEPGKTTVYVRKFNTERDDPRNKDQPYVAVSTRCMHLGCPVRYVQASQRFICPCHGGVYEFDGTVAGGPPVRPLDRFETKVVRGRVKVGPRFSLDSHLHRFKVRDPSNHLDGLWQYLYPSRPTT